ncbi:MAG: MFS transporter [Spirosomataceae bacterium]
MQKNNPSVINAWCMYDWANSVHALVIVSGIFPVYFEETAVSFVKNGEKYVEFLGITLKNSALFTLSVSIAFVIIAVGSPLFSAMADFSGKKKLFMKFFCYLGSICCLGLYFFDKDTITFSTFLFILSLVGWGGSIVFYNSFLPEIVTEDRFDSVSARGFSMGYIGSVILMVFNLTMLLKPEWYGGISSANACKVSFLSVGVWWAGFAQYPFAYLPDNTFDKKPEGSWIFNGFKELKKVLHQLKHLPLLKQFLIAYFVYNMGVQTVMYVAAIFGKTELKMSGSSLIITVLLIQLVAVAGAYGFSKLSSKIGNIRALMVLVSVWVIICITAYLVTEQNQFYALAVMVGAVMGGIQSLSRSTYAKLIPENTEDNASYFSFFDVTDKSSTVVGTLLFGVIDQITNMRNSVLMLLVLFVIGFVLLSRFSSKKIGGTTIS